MEELKDMYHTLPTFWAIVKAEDGVDGENMSNNDFWHQIWRFEAFFQYVMKRYLFFATFFCGRTSEVICEVVCGHEYCSATKICSIVTWAYQHGPGASFQSFFLRLPSIVSTGLYVIGLGRTWWTPTETRLYRRNSKWITAHGTARPLRKWVENLIWDVAPSPLRCSKRPVSLENLKMESRRYQICRCGTDCLWRPTFEIQNRSWPSTIYEFDLG